VLFLYNKKIRVKEDQVFTKNLIFLFFLISQTIGASALPVSLVRNQAPYQIAINATVIKANSVSRIKQLEIPFTSWIEFRRAIIDNQAYCPEKTLTILVGSKKWSLWRNELGIFGIVIDQALPASPNDYKPISLASYTPQWNSSGILLINEDRLEVQV
jgi:hypothetical protein